MGALSSTPAAAATAPALNFCQIAGLGGRELRGTMRLMNSPCATHQAGEPQATLLVVEDDISLAQGLADGLNEAGFSVTVAGTCGEALARIEGGPYSLALLDLGLPDNDGMLLLQALREQHPHMPVIITTARTAVESRVKGLTGGADDYLAKPYDFAELLARIRIQLRHAQRIEPRETIEDLTLDRTTRTATRGSETIDLSPKEFDLLLYLFSLRGGIASREMLARDVWHVRSRMTSMDNIIDVHISRLRQKIDRGRTVPLIHTIRGVGFTLGTRD